MAGARVVYGVHPVREALRSGRVQALFVAEGESGPAIKEILDAARGANVQPVYHGRAHLDELAERGVHQGLVAVVGEYNFAQLDELQHVARKLGQPPLIVVLDSVQDPQNLGALVRTAHVAGAHGIVIPKDRAVGVTPTVVKASAGATEHVKIVTVVNIARALEELKEQGVWIAGAVAAGGSQAPWAIDFTVPIALVLGAEGKGIRPLVLRGCDLQVKIPMSGKVASLNVGAAGAMLLYEVVRQRATKPAG
ncbi:MAG TPA: 23S rRNA (guanosine(2251)-2'-O)-methyltransferase RlmB [Polyangia bacterium]|nr:23S rRNA (guanosine(2251)-2'-O)-methyltransferase RlmB [Polyangia bacterium]